MKKLMALLLAVGMTASIAGAQEVLSRNAVGYVKVEVPGQGLNLVSTPFVNLDGSEMTIADIFGENVADGSIIHLWNPVTALYELYDFIDGIGWDPTGDVLVGRGQGLWFENPQGDVQEIVIMGEVPDQTLPENEVTIVEGLSLISFSFPVELDMDSTLANLTPADGDIIHIWDSDQGDYVLFDYLDGIGWVGGLDDTLIIKPGQSFWYETGTSRTWVNQIPYTWP